MPDIACDLFESFDLTTAFEALWNGIQYISIDNPYDMRLAMLNTDISVFKYVPYMSEGRDMIFLSR